MNFHAEKGMVRNERYIVFAYLLGIDCKISECSITDASYDLHFDTYNHYLNTPVACRDKSDESLASQKKNRVDRSG